ncbi:RNA polymerase sigma factor [Parapedobacter tibetensis]|uniref:RNA polymerase sigma factor n=1 Tax=Parapedobacter tibetensis TaxID=2972951 RepID=UPI00214D186B|nr:sigma-70 family RNA polymerase sigma factor [Parapedobacter tibetensis]
MAINDQLNESRLLISLQKGDAKAFEKLYFFYGKRLYGNVLKMVKSTDVTEEIIQELFQRIWERRETIDVTKSFKSYLFTIAKHLVYDFFHSQTKQRDIESYLIKESTSSYQHIDEEIAFKETHAILTNGILRLPPQRRLIYKLCKIEGKSYEDVSHMLGISTSTISDHIVKATKSLKAYYLSEHAMVLMIALYPL